LSILIGCAQRGTTPEQGTNANAECFGEWNDSFLLGDALIDKQHQELFEMVIEAIGLSESGASGEQLAEKLAEIVTHTVQHFNDEEALKQRLGFSDYDNHKQIHEDFKATAESLVEAFEESGRSAEVLADALENVVLPWVIKHITEEDLKIRAYIKRNN
jgi:hemerythrin